MVRVKKYALAAGMLIVLQGSICLTVAAQQPLLQITSPADGAVVNSDQTITVLVSADPSIHDLMVFTDYRLKVGGSPSPNKFLLTIPATVPPGIYHLTATGANSLRTLVESDPVAIDIERPDDPIKLKTELDLLDFEAVGDQLPITALGTFSDGNTLDITYSSRTTYISNNPNVATVSGEGIATAVGPGETQILIRVVPASTKKSVPAFSIPVRVHKPKANDSSTARPSNCSANSGKGNHASQ